MESELSPEQEKHIPPVPIKTYQWEDLRRSRDAGGYPWTHLLKAPLEGEITAEDIIRETTPRRSMSREFSRSRTHSPFDGDVQRILNLDSSPGSSRRHTDEGEDEGVQVPKFSEEVFCESEEVVQEQPIKTYIVKRPDSQASSHLSVTSDTSRKASPKSILKRRTPEQQYIVQETSKTKCCHPLVNKIKHLADKTLLKLEGKENEKSPSAKRKKKDEVQEIRQLKASPGAIRRQNFSAIKLGDSDEMSKTDTPTPRKKKEHIYEDIDTSNQVERSVQYSEDVQFMDKEEDDSTGNMDKENISLIEKKSLASQDPSLVVEDTSSLKEQEHVMEHLHKIRDTTREAVLLDDELDPDEPNVEEVFQDQLDENRVKSDSPNVTITEIVDEYIETNEEEAIIIPIETSPTPSPREIERKSTGSESKNNDWSKPSSDHEYEIIEKPSREIVFGASTLFDKPSIERTDDELSSNTSLAKHLQDTLEMDANDKDDIVKAEALQRDIEERYFLNTPSSVSRTECEISTSQVDSSALENLPLKRDSRLKNAEKGDNKLQQRFKEGTGKLKSQAGKLKTKFQNMNLPERPKINFPERSKFKLPDRPKFTLPDRPKFTLPDKRKFSLPDRPKFKKINITEKLTFGDRKKFSMPERPKFNVPDFPKFKMPERPKINFPTLGRKKDGQSCSTMNSDTGVEFETKTYPRLFSRKKKAGLQQTSSSPTLNREDTPPPTFTFTRVKKTTKTTSYVPETPEQPREYGNVDNQSNFDTYVEGHNKFETTYDFDNLETGYLESKPSLTENTNVSSTPDISSTKQKYSHINEINNDEFFVRPRGISRENIQVREYLSDEIRQAFKIPKNVLASMGSNSGIHDDTMYDNEADADPELLDEESEPVRYSTEDLNDKDDGYYTFPPVRPSRSKRKKKDFEANIQYIDDSTNAGIHFSEVDLGLTNEYCGETTDDHMLNDVNDHELQFLPTTDLISINEYANDDIIEYPGNVPIQQQTLPMPPKRKKKGIKEPKHSSLHDLKNMPSSEMWDQNQQQAEDIIVYRIEHEYIVPKSDVACTEQSPLPPRRNRSRSSRGTSLGDDDRTSHGAESLTLDTHLAQTDDIERPRQESPGYATVDKGVQRSASRTPPVRRRKSSSSERKYYTVGSTKPMMPDRPPRKKSTTSLVTLDKYKKLSVSADLTQYVEIDEPQSTDFHLDLSSGAVINKMKDRPLPPPPRPPRGSKRDRFKKNTESENVGRSMPEISSDYHHDHDTPLADTTEIEVSTQTDPLPDDVDFELGMDDNIDVSMTSSLRDIIDEDSILGRDAAKGSDIRISRPTSRSEKSLKFPDLKISELAKANVGRTSPTVILVERRVSSPTRINERDVMLTEASLTVQHIDIDESQIPDVPQLPISRGGMGDVKKAKNSIVPADNRAIERVNDTNRDLQLDNLITQRLQVQNLDVSRLNVSELQASKILVSEVEGMTLQVNELDTKSGHISVSGIEFSQSVIDEIVKKFSEITTNQASTSQAGVTDYPRPESREEQTQTDHQSEVGSAGTSSHVPVGAEQPVIQPPHVDHFASDTPPQRPPPPDLTPLLYSYLHDVTMPPTSFYTSRQLRERPFTEFHESQHHSAPPPNRRAKRKPAAPYSDSSSEHERRGPSPRRMPTPAKAHEPTVTEAGVQFLRVCQNSVGRTIRNIFNSFMSYISGTEDKKDMQMALVIFLVLIAGLIMFGLSDSRTVHHHHWEFFNPPDTDTKP